MDDALSPVCRPDDLCAQRGRSVWFGVWRIRENGMREWALEKWTVSEEEIWKCRRGKEEEEDIIIIVSVQGDTIMILHADVASIIKECSENGDLETLRESWKLVQESYYCAAGPDKPGTVIEEEGLCIVLVRVSSDLFCLTYLILLV